MNEHTKHAVSVGAEAIMNDPHAYTDATIETMARVCESLGIEFDPWRYFPRPDDD